MNQLIGYLAGRLGKKTCPIVGLYVVHDTGFDSPYQFWVEIKFKDGSVVELIEKPKT